jgi:hypothetical protein
MKKTYLLLLLIFIGIYSASAQKTDVKKDPVGKWLFEAPYAPEGFTVGTIDVTLAEKELKATMVFTANGYSLSGEKVRFQNDSLLFSIFMEGEDIAIKLRFDDEKTMSGAAIYSEGEVPLLLKREIKKD